MNHDVRGGFGKRSGKGRRGSRCRSSYDDGGQWTEEIEYGGSEIQVEYLDIGFNEYQRLVIHQLEAVGRRLEKIQFTLTEINSTVQGFETCVSAPPLHGPAA
jgi:ribosomal protein L15